MQTIEEFRREARAWLEANATPRASDGKAPAWGEGSDSVALFQNLDFEEEKAHIDAHRAWIAKKADAGFANVTWDVEWGGRGLPAAYQHAFEEEERRFDVPPAHEAIAITTHLVAPTILAAGTPEQKERFIRPALRTDEMWCQLFSEPGAGSDLAGLASRAERDGDEWVLNGQKVWTSGAQYADWGFALCRTDPEAPKHRGLTAFLVPMSVPGVEIRPLRQATGGASFNEVFFSDVRVPDEYRIGEVGAGWNMALVVLGFERSTSSDERGAGNTARLVALARHLGKEGDPVCRQALMKAYIDERVLRLTDQRAKAGLAEGARPGPEGSLGKLMWTQLLQTYNGVASLLLGPRLIADSGEWGTYAWSEHVVGTAGYRIAGGSDEVQRNIIGERVLGLPGEPRVDRDVPWRAVPR